jgi:hypothetical protein
VTANKLCDHVPVLSVVKKLELLITRVSSLKHRPCVCVCVCVCVCARAGSGSHLGMIVYGDEVEFGDRFVILPVTRAFTFTCM